MITTDQQIAQTGTRFDKCITPHPMCQAARASILTGKLPYSHGVRDSGRNLPNHFGAEGLGGIFSAADYQTHFNEGGNGRQRWEKAKVHANPPGLADTTHLQVWRSALHDEWHSTPWIGDRTMDMIREKGDDPLFAWVSFPDPHPPFLAAEPWWHRAFLESPIRKNVKRPHAQDGVSWTPVEGANVV